MLRFFSLSSGSCGNCYYLGTSEKGILIDAGASCRRLVRMLKDNDINLVDTKEERYNSSNMFEKLKSALPFELTEDQLNAVEQVITSIVKAYQLGRKKE